MRVGPAQVTNQAAYVQEREAVIQSFDQNIRKLAKAPVDAQLHDRVLFSEEEVFAKQRALKHHFNRLKPAESITSPQWHEKGGKAVTNSFPPFLFV